MLVAPPVQPQGKLVEKLRDYDIVSVEASEERTVLDALATGQVDLVRIDGGQRPPFALRRKLLEALRAHDAFVEVDYASAIRGVLKGIQDCVDASCRRNFFQTLTALWRVTHGERLVLTGGAREALEVRSAADLTYIVRLARAGNSADRYMRDHAQLVLERGRRRSLAPRGVALLDPTSKPLRTAVVRPKDAWSLLSRLGAAKRVRDDEVVVEPKRPREEFLSLK